MNIYKIILYFSVIFCFFAEAMDIETCVDPKDRTHNVVMRYVKEQVQSYVKEQVPSYVDDLPPQLFKWTTDVPEHMKTVVTSMHYQIWEDYIKKYKRHQAVSNTLCMQLIFNNTNVYKRYNFCSGDKVDVSCYKKLIQMLEWTGVAIPNRLQTDNRFQYNNFTERYAECYYDTEMQVLLNLCGICRGKNNSSANADPTASLLWYLTGWESLDDSNARIDLGLLMYSRLDPCGLCMELLSVFSNVMNSPERRDIFVSQFIKKPNFEKIFKKIASFRIYIVSDMPYQDSMLAGVTLPYIKSMAAADEAVPQAVAPRITCYRYRWQKYIAP